METETAHSVSWLFYNTIIDEVFGSLRTTRVHRPYKFLYVSLTPEELTSFVNAFPVQSNPEIEHRISDSFPE